MSARFTSLKLWPVYIYNYTLIFQIEATNIISLPGLLFLKYQNQMVRNMNPTVTCYEDTIATSRDLKNLSFCINFKTSINGMTYENAFCVTENFFIKEFKASLVSASFHKATSLHFIMVSSWFEIIASFMANLIVKFKCSSCGNEFNQKWANLLIYNNNFWKYKFVLCSLKEDGGNRSVSVHKTS